MPGREACVRRTTLVAGEKVRELGPEGLVAFQTIKKIYLDEPNA